MSDSTISDKFKSLTQREHVYKLPDSYVGSIEESPIDSWKVDGKRMVESKLNNIPGFYKIFDEVIVNAWDQYVRMKDTKEAVKNIDVIVDKSSGLISVKNDGKGIDIAMHPKEKMYTVQMIFGKLLTSTNYNENEERLTGGKNGFGSKLTNIFSNSFEVETVDKNNKLHYYQKFEKNMTMIGSPIIKKIPSSFKEYTKITYVPDFERFGIKGITDDMVSIFKRRCYELSACSDISVTFNSSTIPVKKFKDYAAMFCDNKIICEKPNIRWEICVSPSEEFKQISFVNGINTSKGGKHVDYILSKICKRLAEIIEKKEKIKVKANHIKEHLFVFVNCLIVNPSFDSQTKDYLTTVSSKFGSSFEFSDKFFKDLANTDIIKSIVNTYNFKENKGNKKNDGKKTSKIYGIPKLDDANWAGGRKSQECALFLTEGDSAATFAIAGLSVIGRDKYGVFPLRGKVINARDKITTQAGLKQVNANSELIHLKQILGLEQGKKYTDTSTLRYGKIIILTDQDLDGSHIKGLILNWVDTFWPDLLSKNFVSVFQTPIIKAKKGKQEEVFYSLKKFEDWKTTVENSTSFHTKYFKGLATSNTQEAKEYFKKLTLQTFNSSDNSKDAVDKAFNKNRADDRKRWLKKYDKNNIIDEEQKSVTCEEFIDKELIHFSNYDVQRSIPHLMDGFKPSQRKILFACFKRKLTKEIRVAQLAGYVSEHSGYHHGEASLNGAIIGMAQDFMGSNNINLLSPNGQFGSRIQNGKDAGSPRYIHTALTDISTKLYISSDEASLEFLEDDGLSIEPVYYAPVIPMILVNGSQGIGTGYSTSIPMFNPKDIFKQVRNKIDGKSIESLTPYYHGFKGSIVKDGNGFVTKGKYRQLNYKTLLIDELPIGTSIDEFKNFIDDVVMNLNDKKKKLDKKYVQFQGVKGYTSQSTESCVHFEIEFDPIVLQSLMKKVSKQKTSLSNDIEKMFKLASKVSTSNMHLFQTNGIIKKFKNTTEIIDSFYIERLRLYGERKRHMLDDIQDQMNLLENKVRFLNAVIKDEIVVRKLNKEELIDELTRMKFAKVNENFNYLINIAIYKITKDEIKKLNDEFSGKTTEFELLSKTNIEDLWRSDLKVLELSLEKKYKSV